MERTRWVKQGMLWAVCLVMVLCTISAQAITIPEAVGRWYFVAADDKGLSGDDYIDLNRDKSVTIVAGGDTTALEGLTWRISGEDVEIKTAEGKYLSSLEYDGSNLSWLTTDLTAALELTGNRTIYRFTLSRTPNAYDTPEAQHAEKEDQFYGNYEQYLSVRDGQYTAVESGKRVIAIAEYVLTETFGYNTQDYLTNFTDGVLRVYEQDEWVFAVTENPDILVAYQAADETGLHLYFRRTGSEETQE